MIRPLGRSLARLFVWTSLAVGLPLAPTMVAKTTPTAAAPANFQSGSQVQRVAADATLQLTSLHQRAGETWRFEQPSRASTLTLLVDGAESATLAGKIVTNGGLRIVSPGGLFLTSTAHLSAARVSLATTRGESLVVPVGYVVGGTAPRGALRQLGRIEAEEIEISAGLVEAAGVLDATGVRGGRVTITGDLIAVMDTARIDASGERDGGQVLIGGDTRGAAIAGQRNARRTVVAPDAQLRADAGAAGKGGKIVVWADELTRFLGQASARGGRTVGSGGFAEISGQGSLDYRGLADLRTASGTMGTLLLDPTDVTISGAGVDAAPTAGSFSGGTFGGSSASTSTISIGSGAGDTNNTLLKQLALANVVIATSSAGGGLGNITVTGAISYNSANSLTLNATGSIVISSPITNAGTGSLSLIAASTIAVNAAVTCSSVSATAGGNISQSGNFTVAGAASFKTLNNAGASILLTNDGNAFGSVAALVRNAADSGNANATINLHETGGTTMAGILTAGDLVVVTNGGALTQTGSVIVGGSTAVSAGAAPITLTNTGNDFTGAVSISNSGANNVAVTDSNALKLGTVTVGAGNLTVSANQGGVPDVSGITQLAGTAITQAAGAGAASFSGGAGQIKIENANNNFTGTVSFSNTGANSVSVRDDVGGTQLGSTSVGTDLTVRSSGGNIAQLFASPLVVPGTFRLIAPAFDVSLQENNTLSRVVIESAQHAALKSVSGLSFGDNSGTLTGVSTVSGNLTITSSGGAITQTEALLVTGTTALNAGAGAITLTNAGNNFTDAVNLTNVGANDVSITDSNSVNLGTIAVGRNLTVNSGGTTALTGGAVSTGGAQVYNGPVTLGADTTLTTTNSPVSFNSTLNSATSTPRALTVNSGSGAVKFVGAVGGTNALGTITLPYAANVFSTPLAWNSGYATINVANGDHATAANITSGTPLSTVLFYYFNSGDQIVTSISGSTLDYTTPSGALYNEYTSNVGLGTVVNSSSLWGGPGSLLKNGTSQFVSGTEGFIGFSVDTGGGRRYGYLSLTRNDATNSWLIHGYALANSAGVGITTQSLSLLPTITTQPVAQTVSGGANVNFTVAATGPGSLTYQWKKAGAALAGATNATLALTNAQFADSGSYSVTVSNSAGSVTSASVGLTVNAPPSITTQPQPVAVNAGAGASLSVVATGSPTLTYQWKKDNAAIAGATNATLALAAVQAADAGSYTVVVTNGFGNVTSSASLLALNVPPAITTQPANLAAAVGANATFTVVASGTAPLSYQWEKGGTVITGATSATLTLNNVQVADAASYTVTVSNVAGTATSNAAALTVNIPPTITTVPAAVTIDYGQSTTLTAAATGTPAPTYQWYQGASGNTANPISGATSATYTTPALTGTNSYWVRVTNAAGHSDSATVTVTVNPAYATTVFSTPMAWSSGYALINVLNGTHSTAANVFAGTPLSTVLFYYFNSGDQIVTNLSGSTLDYTTPSGALNDQYTSNVGLGAAVSGSSIWGGPGSLLKNGTSQFVSGTEGFIGFAIDTGGGRRYGYLSLTRNDATNSWLIHGYALANVPAIAVTTQSLALVPNITTQPVGQTVSGGANVSLTVAASGPAPLSYQWNKSGSAIPGATNATLSLPNAQFADNGSYTVTVSNSAGSVISVPASVVVNTPPTVTAQPQALAVNTGASASLSVSATGTAPLTYQWKKGGTDVAGATGATLTIAAAVAGDAGSYTVVVTNGFGSVTSTAAALTVNVPPAITTQPVAQTVTAGASASFSVVATGTAPLTYQWKKGAADVAGATGASLTLASVQPGDAASYSVVVTNMAGSATSGSAALTVNVVPAISTQPVSQVAVAGSSVTFSVVATGTPAPTYQWKKGGTNVSGATAATLSLANVQPADAASYTVVVTNAAGTVTSNAATLTVNVPPAITTQPVAQTVTAGASVTFSVVATGTPTPAYQWKKAGVDITGASNASYAIASAQAGDAASYTVVVSNVAGSVTSTAAALTVNVPPAITTQPAAVSIVAGNTATLSVVATGTAPLTYQWYQGTSPSTATPISGATAASYTTPALLATTSYWVRVSNAAGSADSATGVVTVTATSVATTIFPTPLSWSSGYALVNVLTGERSTASSVTSGTPLSTVLFYYFASSDQIVTNISGSTLDYTTPSGVLYDQYTSNVGLGATVSSASLWGGPGSLYKNGTSQFVSGTEGFFGFSIDTGGGKRYGYFSLTRNDATNTWAINGFALADSPNGPVTVQSLYRSPVINTQPVAQTVTAGANVTFAVAATGTPAPTYQWKKTGADIAGATNATLTLTNVQAVDAASYTVVVANAVGSVTSNASALTVNPAPMPPAITTAPVAQTVTAGSSAAFSVVASGTAPLAYQWKKNGADIAGATTANLALSNVQVGDAASYTVTVTNTLGTVTSMAATLTVNVSPAITTQPVSQVANVGTAVTFSVVATGTPAPTYQWKNGANNIAGATSQSLTLASVQLSDAAGYSVVVTNSVGSVTSSAATLTVNAPPAITSQPVARTVTSGGSATFSVVATGTPAPAYQWRKGGANIAGATGSSYTIAATVAADAGSYEVVVTNVAGSVTSNVATLTVATMVTTIFPTPLVWSSNYAQVNVLTGAYSTSANVVSGTPYSTVLFYYFTSADQIVTNMSGSSLDFTTPSGALYDEYTSNVGLGATVGASSRWGGPGSLFENGTSQFVSGTEGFFGFSINSGTGTRYGYFSLVRNAAANNWAIYGFALCDTPGVPVTTQSLIVPAAPVITTQPVAQTVVAGTNASFSVVATGTPLPDYQWKKDGTSIVGATNSSLVLNGVQTADAAAYTVVVSNASGSVTSSAAALTVTIPPVAPSITTQPVAQTVTAGAGATFSVVASGTAPLAYQWKKNGADLPGATGASLALASAQPSDAASYTVVVSNVAGSVTSSAALLSVNVAPAITTQPVAQIATVGASVTFAVVATGTPAPTYQWKKGATNLTGATGASLTLASVQLADAASYSVVVTNVAGSVTSDAASLTVNVPPAITTQPIAQTVTAGANVTFTVAATGTPAPTYQWRKAGANLPGATNPALTLANAQPADAASYTVVVSNVAGSVTSTAATLTVNVPPAITTQPVAASVIAGQTATMSVTATGTAPLSYQWYQGNSPSTASPISGATGASYTTPTLATTTSYWVRVTNVAGSADSATAVVTVSAAPVTTVIFPTPLVWNSGYALVNVLNGDYSTAGNVFAGTPLSTVLFYYFASADQIVTNISGSTLDYTTPSGVLNNEYTSNVGLGASVSSASLWGGPGSLFKNGTSQFVSGTEGFFGFSIDTGSGKRYGYFSLTRDDASNSWAINGYALADSPNAPVTTQSLYRAPQITTQPVAQTVTAGANVTFSVTATGTPAPTYQWKKAGVNIAGATSATLSLNNTQAADAANYSVAVTNAGGSATSNAVSLTVNPAPVAPAITTQPAAQVVTAGGSAAFSVVATGTAPLAYQWKKNATNVAGATNASLSFAAVQLADAGSYTVVVTNAVGSVTSSAATLTVNVAPAITTPPQTIAVTGGQGATFTVVATGTPAPTYQWRKNGTNLAGGTSATLTIAAVQATDAGTYSVVVTNAAGSVTASATLTVMDPAQAYRFTTLAGLAETSGSTDAAGAAARFRNPVGVAVDAAGVVYVADADNHTIRKITAGGVVTTLAGLAGTSGAVDGTGSAARFNTPQHLALDSAGNLYVADGSNHTIRKVTPAGVVTTLAGTAGAQGFADGTGSAARFNYPRGIAVDSAGNVYVGDHTNFTIRKITPAGVVSTLAGLAGVQGSDDGTGSNARFYLPFGVAVDATGNVFVGDYGNLTVRKITPAGVVTTVAGLAGLSGAADGVGSAARFYTPMSVALDAAGNLYLAEYGNSTVRKVAPNGAVTTLAGLALNNGSTDGVGSAARFNGCHGIAVDRAGNIYVADTLNHTIRWGALAVPVFASPATARGAVDQAFSYTANFTGALGNITSGALPDGLSLNSTSGVISGTPVTTGIYPVTLMARNGAGTATAALTLTLVNRVGPVAAVFNAATDVPVTSSLYVATGSTVNFTLNFAPVPGTTLMVVKNTGSDPIEGTYTNLAQAQLVALTYNGTTYNFIANYYGGTGNDLVLQWAGTQLFGAGDNRSGQLGNGTTTSPTVPVLLAGGVKTAASAGGLSAYVLNDGSLWAVGSNVYGALGDGTTIDRATPVRMATGVRAVVTGSAYTLFLKNDGTLWGTGRNDVGQLGDGTTVDRNTPVQVASDVQAVATGWYHTLFLKTNGTVWATGHNALGQLGDGTTTYRSTPVQVATGVVAVAAGSVHSLWIKADGSLWAVGSNEYGQLGDGTGINRLTAVQVATGVATVACGQFHSLLVKTDGTLWTMGNNGQGQLGDGTTVSRFSPVSVATGVASVAAGVEHSLFVKTDGTLWTVGSNELEQQFDGTTSSRSTPRQARTGVLAAFSSSYSRGTLFLQGVGVPAITSPASANGTIGVAFGGYTLTATNSPTAFAATGLPPGLALNSATGAITGTPTAIGVYPVTLSAGNSAGTAVANLSVTVAKANQTIAFGPLSARTFGDASFALGATASSGLAVAYTSSNSAVATVSGSSVTIVGAGTTTITARQAGDASFNAAADVTQTLIVNKATATVALSGLSQIFNGTPKPVTATTLPAGLSVTFTYSGSATAPTAAGTYAVVATVVDANYSGGATGTLTIAAPPAITTQPTNQVVVAGNAASFSVVATGDAPLTYQWRKDGSSITGATSATYALASAQVANAGSYTVVVTNAVGSVTSSAATLTVNVAPAITTPPQTIAVTAGQAATFTVAATGTPAPTYQWKKNGADVAGATSATLTIAAVQATDAGTYSVVVTNAAGSVTASATLTVVDPTQAYRFTTLAGLAETSGSTDAAGAAARFRNPVGVAVDAAGVVYVADADNHTIRKITAGGVVTTLAGLAGTSGAVDGTGSAARFNTPQHLALDSAGNLYVADGSNHTIRKVTPAGVVTTLAGTAGAQGFTDGTGSAARFNYPRGIAVDSAGNVYVGDHWNFTIRKITPTGVVSTLAGLAGVQGSDDGTGSNARFYLPFGVAVDATGNVFVGDYGNLTVRKITPAGVVTTVAGLAGVSGAADGVGSAARFYTPMSVALDATGNLYLAEYGNSTVRKVAPDGAVTTLAGLALSNGSTDGTGSAARFNGCHGIAVDRAGNIYVADTLNHTIRWGALAVPVFASPATARGTVAQAFTYTANFTGALGNITSGVLPDGLSLNSATGVISGTSATAGVYPVTLTARNGAGTANATLTITIDAASAAPFITGQPVAQTTAPGGAVTLAVTASGVGPFTYQWSQNGVAVAGATNASLVINNAQLANTGRYSVTVTNAAGTTTSAPAQVNLSGQLWSVGTDSYGQLGIGTPFNRETPLPIGSGIKAAAAGGDMQGNGSFSLYVTSDGTLWGLGANSPGQLGDGTTNWRRTPVQIATGVSAVAASAGAHSMFLKTDGTLWVTGANSSGQLGNGTTVNQSTPVQIATGVAAIAAGGNHSLFVKTDGTLWAVGANSSGQLGNGTMVNQSSPVQVATGVASVAAGFNHSLFVKTDGTLWAMGANSRGQLGNGTTVNQSTPVQVATGIASVASGSGHSLFVKTDGTLWAIGFNAYSQLGDGTQTDRSAPVQVAAGVGKATGGGTHSLFVKTDGTLWAMGNNYDGALGDGTLISRSTPALVTSGVGAVAASGLHAMFLKTDGSLWGMGYNWNFGQLGLGTTNDYRTPAQVTTDVRTVATGRFHSLYVKADGTLWTMGNNASGQLGDGTTTTRRVPVQVATDVSAIAGGTSHSLFLKNDGTVWAMGLNTSGQLGDGTTTNQLTPVQVATGVSAIAAGGSHSLFLKTDGTLWATGLNTSGQLGNGTTTTRNTPVQVASGVSAIAAGDSHSLYVKTDGSLWATGLNSLGQLGNGTTVNRSTFAQVASGVGAIAASSSHSLFLKTDGTLWAMGGNGSGALGDGTTVNRSTPVQVAANVVGLAAGTGGASSYFIQAAGPGTVPTITTQPVGGSYGYGASVTLTAAATGSVPVDYQWRKDGVDVPGARSATLFIASVQASDAGNYTVVVTNSAGTATSQPATVTLTATTPPTITKSPVGQNVTTGASVTFTVEATSMGPIGYQWRKGGTNVAGATNASYTIASAQTSDAGSYDVVVSNSAGNVTSSAAVLTVTPPATAPTITAQPQGATIASGLTHTLSVTAAGTAPLTYQWYQGTSPSTAAPIAGATAATYTTPAVTATTSYWVRVSNTVGAADSATATVSVASFVPTVALTAEPTSNYVTTGGTVTLRARVTYTGQSPAAIGVSVALPAGWSFASYSGGASAAPVVGDNLLEWAFSSMPANELTFTFTANHPAGQSGTKSVTGSVNYRPGNVDVPFTAVALTPITPPTITTQPAGKLAAIETGTTFSVVASGTGTLSYQWKKDGTALANDSRITGATTATLSLANLTTADAGNYTVVVTNAAGSTTSSAAALAVVDARATHSVIGAGYTAGGTVTLTQTVTYATPCTGLSWQLLLPTGWSYASGGGAEGQTKPAVGATSLLEWTWTTIPASPVTFTVTLNVPAGETGDKTIASLAVFRVAAGPVNVLAKPDPLTVSAVTNHSADSDKNFRISLLELTRVIELYNARNGSSRTGCYKVEVGSEDGFNPDPTRLSSVVVTLATYHSADSDRNGKISLLELTRVIELYNYRNGTSRTGQYHAQAGTEDGFSPGP